MKAQRGKTFSSCDRRINQPVTRCGHPTHSSHGDIYFLMLGKSGRRAERRNVGRGDRLTVAFPGPATGYNYLTMCCVALYFEHSLDPDALRALRRATEFHIHYTWPNGMPAETINGRNRYWPVPTWGHFGFSCWLDGRRYAALLTENPPESPLSNRDLGRIGWGLIRHHGWVLRVSESAELTWPEFPFNPCRNAPETELSKAVGLLRVPVQVGPAELPALKWRTAELSFALEVPAMDQSHGGKVPNGAAASLAAPLLRAKGERVP